jgi:hypothetical protein
LQARLQAAATLALLLAAGCAQAGSLGTASGANFCDRQDRLSVADQDRLLRFAAVVRTELAGGPDDDVALISRSGLDLSRFAIRYSHAAIALRGADGAWSARQLYFACDEKRPRIFDQGIAGFAMGTDDPALGYIAIVRLPAAAAEAANALDAAARDKARALHLLAGRYSANAYPWSLRYQNCNQWVIEMMASAWGGLDDGADLRARAQDWLRGAGYAPQPVAVASPLIMLASYFVPLVHLDDHPPADRAARRLQVSLPSTIESFVHQRLPGAQRVEICHTDKEIVVHRGWTPVAEGCVAGADDTVVALD